MRRISSTDHEDSDLKEIEKPLKSKKIKLDERVKDNGLPKGGKNRIKTIPDKKEESSEDLCNLSLDDSFEQFKIRQQDLHQNIPIKIKNK